MNDETVRALNAINRAFYLEFSDDFASTRQSPWTGWIRLLSTIDPSPPPRGDLDVLDVGCGNGRFAKFLAENLPNSRRSIRYIGVDASERLLAEGRERKLPLQETTYRFLDFIETPLANQMDNTQFDLVVLFGVLHHVPGSEQRQQLLRDVANSLRHGGLLILTAWQFQTLQRFRDKIVPWESYNRSALRPIAASELEPGDHLLPWGEQTGGVRYCHFSDDEELQNLFQPLSCELVETYVADGRGGNLNRYFILRRCSANETGTQP